MTLWVAHGCPYKSHTHGYLTVPGQLFAKASITLKHLKLHPSAANLLRPGANKYHETTTSFLFKAPIKWHPWIYGPWMAMVFIQKGVVPNRSNCKVCCTRQGCDALAPHAMCTAPAPWAIWAALTLHFTSSLPHTNSGVTLDTRGAPTPNPQNIPNLNLLTSIPTDMPWHLYWYSTCV